MNGTEPIDTDWNNREREIRKDIIWASGLRRLDQIVID